MISQHIKLFILIVFIFSFFVSSNPVLAAGAHESFTPSPTERTSQRISSCEDTYNATSLDHIQSACSESDITSVSDPNADNYCTNLTRGEGVRICEFDNFSNACKPRENVKILLCLDLKERGHCTGDCPPLGTTDPEASETITDRGFSTPRLQVPILTVKPFTEPFVDIVDGKNFITIDFLSNYIIGIYSYLVGIAGITAGIMIVWAGIKWLTSAGAQDRIKDAKEKIANAIIGLILLLTSYLLLNAVNPALVNINPIRVEVIEKLLLELGRAADGQGGGADGPDARVGGKGDIEAADRTACPILTPGTEFSAAFTSYYTISANEYGTPGSFRGIYKGTDPELQDGMGDFFCAVAMECSCPNGAKLKEKTCQNSRGKSWRPCAFFERGTKYCSSKTGRYQHVAGQTVAASTCFPRPCKIQVGGRILDVTDRGSGIIGTHFDLYRGTKGEADYITDTSWLTETATIVECEGKIGPKEISRMRGAYNGYKPGICNPGTNC